MAGLDNISIEEFKRVMAEAVLEGTRLSRQGAGPSTGVGLGGSLDLGDVDEMNKKAASAGAMLKNMQERLAVTNKGMLAYQQVMRGAELATVTFGDNLKEIDDEIAKLAVSTDAAAQAEAVRLQGMRDETRQRAMGSQAYAAAINATMKLGQVISGTVLPGMFNVARGLNDGADAADIAGSALTTVIDTVEGSFKALTTTMAETGKGLASLGGTAGKVGVAMIALAPIIEMIVGAGAKLAKEMMALAGTAYKRNADMFNTLNASGAVFADGLEGMRKASYDAGMTTEQFSRTIQKNSATFAQAGIGVTEATKLMGGAMKIGGESMKRDMLALGYGFEEQGELMAETMANMRASGKALTAGDQAAIAQQTAKYAENLKVISAITGEDAKKKMQEAKEAAANLAFQQKLAGMDAKQRDNIMNAMANMSKQQQKNFMDTMVFGQVVNKAGAAMEATSTNFAANNQALVDAAKNGTLDAESARNINAKFAEGVRQDMLNAKEIGMAGLADVGGIAKDLSVIMADELKMRQKFNQETVKAVENQLKGQKDQAKDPDSATGKMVANMQAAQDVLVAQQKLTDKLADQYSKVIQQTLTGIKELQEKINEFSSMGPEDIAKAMSAAEWTAKILGAITALTVAITLLGGKISKIGGGGLGGGDQGGRKGRGGRMSRMLSGAKNLAGTGARAVGAGGGALLKGGLKAAAGAAKFIPGVGLAVTAAMGIFDGMTAGIEEYKKSGSIGKAVKEGFAGAVSGLTFGLVDQKTISDGMTAIGDFASNSFKALKEQVSISAIKDKVSGIAKSVTGAVGNFFGGLFGGAEKEAKKPDSASEAKTDPKQAKIEQLKSRIESLKEQLASGSQRTMRARKNKRDLEYYENQLKQLQPTSTTSGVSLATTPSAQTGKPLEDAKQAEMTKQQEEAKKKAESELAAKNEEAKKKEQERLAGMNPQERTNELLTRVVSLLDDSAGSQRTLARNSL